MSNYKLFIIISLLCFCAGAAWADDVRKPAYQLEDNSFFDPTRKQEQTEKYTFAVEYRIEAGYAQHNQRSANISFPDMYLHGARVGATFTFLLPIHFSLQTGALYTILHGRNDQHYVSTSVPTLQSEYIHHNVLAHNLTIPLRMYYTIPLWKQLNLFFYTGPQLHIGLAQFDYLETHLSDEMNTWLGLQNIPTEPYDRMLDELIRANIQWGVGGGLEWDCYRLQSGYDFGLNNMVKHPVTSGQFMSEWSWFVTFSYRF